MSVGQNSLTRALQREGLDILSVIDCVCAKYGIPYYLFYGTELGVVRHKGFIPWDDDVDIILFRKDFDAFKAAWMREKPAGYFYQDTETDPGYRQKITKIRKDGTALVEEKFKNVEMHHGVWVDLFALDDYVKNPFLRRVSELFAMFEYNAVRNHRPSGARGLLYWITNRLFRSGRLYRWWFGRVFPRLKKDEAMCSDIDSFTLSHKYDFKREWLGTPQRLPFEGVLLPAPADTDSTLKACYGDYMTLPPEEKRVSNHHPYFFSVTEEYHPGMAVPKEESHG